VPVVSDRSAELDFGAHGPLPVFWRNAPRGQDGGAVPVYLHGVPSSSDEWIDFLAAGGGIAPDLLGFGRSAKPGFLTFTIDEYDRFLECLLDHLGLERVSLVMHDWGAVGLALAQRQPERVERIVLINAVPFLPGYRWHRTARIWRTLGLGELAMGVTGHFTLRLASRESNATPGPMPESWLASTLSHLDQGTQRAILRLYRSSPPAVLAAAGEHLGELDVPALVVWGMRDPYIPSSFAAAYASALPRAELVELPDAGHWPWLDRPDVVELVVGFLDEA